MRADGHYQAIRKPGGLAHEIEVTVRGGIK